MRRRKVSGDYWDDAGGDEVLTFVWVCALILADPSAAGDSTTTPPKKRGRPKAQK